MIKYPQHSIGARMPKMSDSDFLSLKADIASNGYRKDEPIILYEGRVLDGWHRINACYELNIEPVYVQYLDICVDNMPPLLYVWSKNKNRRHLKPEQAAALAVDCLSDLNKQAKVWQMERQKKYVDTGTIAPGAIMNVDTFDEEPWQKTSIHKAAKEMGTSAASVAVAAKAKEQLPEVFDKMIAGTITIKKAKNELYKKNEAEKKSTVDIEIKSDNIRLHPCDIVDCKVDDNSIDLIATDPPYPRGYLSCWSHLAKFASEKLKEGGILLALSGQSYLPEVLANMKIEGLSYYWTCCVYQPGTTTQLQVKRLNCNWKPLLVFVKGTYTKTFQPSDVYISDYKDTLEGKQYHDWGQNLQIFSKLVQDWSYANETVCDPFLGGGTSGVAAVINGRKFIGVEVNKSTYDIASERIYKADNEQRRKNQLA